MRIGELVAAVHGERVGAATCANAPSVTVAWLHSLMSSERAQPTRRCAKVVVTQLVVAPEEQVVVPEEQVVVPV